jgi:penicillin-binding protein 1C
MIRWLKKYRYYFLSALAGLLILYYFSLPSQLFNDPYSSVLEDKNENLLSASIASDGQWRFPEGVTLPEKYKQAVVLFEDKRFYTHIGVDVLSMARAIRQNLRAGHVISGGSTLSMQLIRLERKNRSRTFFEKIIEVILATRLELRYSKEEILALYAAHAPFGGNVVGIEAASWRYFGRNLEELSWSEAALLAVLPNNPSLIRPGKNQQIVKQKRDQLLVRLSDNGTIDPLTVELAMAEPVPESPLSLPRHAPHLLDRMMKEGMAQKKVVSTIDMAVQQRTLQIIDDHYQQLKNNQIANAAAIIIDVKTGNVIAYVGNTESGSENNNQVDVIRAPRSTGSILKPFLYAAMLHEGKMLQHTLVPDVPVVFNGFSPRNFSKNYDGVVSADKALIRSLNIPAVHELRDYRYEKFYELLKHVGLTTLTKPADHYGLSLILGGAEGTLWDITGAYASMARTLNNYFTHPGINKYDPNDFHSPQIVNRSSKAPDNYPDEAERVHDLEPTSTLNASSIYLTFDALKEVYRPGEGTGWKYFTSTKRIAWKTGTSFGFRDGWAVGVTPEYAVGVWVGNADGEGRPGLTGTETAAPILFDLFSSLPGNSWFRAPLLEMEKIPVCSRSGHRASALCESTDTVYVARAGLQTLPCSYHKAIHLSEDMKYRVNSECLPVDKMKTVNWFVLSPVQGYYYQSKNLSYQPLPPFSKECTTGNAFVSMDLIYPKANAKIFVPRELGGQTGNTVFEAAHRNPKAIVYWHLDGTFIGTTQKSHRLAVAPPAGRHILTLVDERGEMLVQPFRVISGQDM